MEQIFLSYSRADRGAAIVLRSALEGAGLSVFRDEDSIRVSERWRERLEASLQVFRFCCFGWPRWRTRLGRG